MFRGMGTVIVLQARKNTRTKTTSAKVKAKRKHLMNERGFAPGLLIANDVLN